MYVSLQTIIRVMLVVGFFCFGPLAFAEDIKGNQITATTTMAPWGGFTIDQIADGKSADQTPFNGFTTNQKTGTITLTFDQAYNIDGFRLWNDVNVRAEGIASFRLYFWSGNNGKGASPVFTTVPSQTNMQLFAFPRVDDITKVEMVVLSSIKEATTFMERIEVREIGFRQAPPSPPNLWPMLVGLGLLGVGGLFLFQRNRRISRKLSRGASLNSNRVLERPRKPEPAGVIFPGSPMMATNVATPLSSAGQLTASNLQMLTGPYAVLRDAYSATGRIGYAQEGVPSSEDYSFGTGFLITPYHVMTNRHVHGFYGQYLTGENCGGIEFIAEKDKDASDFIAFNGEPPILVPGLDIAIFKLARKAENRVPLARVAVPNENLDARDIVVVGYPDTYEPDNAEVLSVVEDDPVFAVKRISQGRIFRHSTDTDAPYGVETIVSEDDKTSFSMLAICHNASTMGGNSGSPILDTKTGELLGVHFSGHKIFNKKEAANLAMAIALVAQETKELSV